MVSLKGAIILNQEPLGADRRSEMDIDKTMEFILEQRLGSRRTKLSSKRTFASPMSASRRPRSA